MNCFNHPERPAVVQCKRCGRGFCKEESGLLVDGMCPECQHTEKNQRLEFLKNQSRAWYKSCLWKSLIWGVALVLLEWASTGNLRLSDKGPLVCILILMTIGFIWGVTWAYSGLVIDKICQKMGCLINAILYLLARCFIVLAAGITGIIPIVLICFTLYMAFIHIPKQ